MSTVLSFGKHKGKAIAELDNGYLRWMHEKLDNHWGKLAAQVLQLRNQSHVLRFGKYAGKTLSEVPEGYLHYLARELKDKEAGILAREILEHRNVQVASASSTREATTACRDAGRDSIGKDDSGYFGGGATECIAKLKECREIEQAKVLHRQARASKFFAPNEVYLSNLMILMFGRCGAVEEARSVFRGMQARNTFTWDTMLKVFLDNGRADEAMSTFQAMEVASTISCTAMVSLYGLQGRSAEAKRAFDRIPSSDVDRVAWNALVVSYAKNGRFEEALETFKRMGERNVVSWNAVLSAATQEPALVKAGEAFKLMPLWDAASCTTMLSVYGRLGGAQQVKELFLGMENRDATAWAVLILAYAQCGQMQEAEEALRRMPAVGEMALVNMVTCYRDNDSMEESNKLMINCGAWSVKVWNALMAGYSIDGQVSKAVELLHAMNLEGSVVPDDISFLCILDGYSHVAKTDDGRNCFISMMSDHGIEASCKHYNCMVDMVARTGHLAKAEELVSSMPFQPDPASFYALLGACRSQKDVERAKRLVETAAALEPLKPSSYVLMANTSNEEDVEMVKVMKKKGLKRVPGVSTVRVKNKVHSFVVGDTSHPRAKAINKELERLNLLMKEAGYAPNTSVALLPGASDKEKQELLCKHSEKLALAFGMISTQPGTKIQITKNLRMCYDCHDATRFISKVVGRTIVVRDANRIHRFAGGACSCGDIW